MNCATCQSWQIKSSALARNGAAPCAHLPRWEHYPPRHTCERHKPADAEVAAVRLDWLAKLDNKHKLGVKK